ncbi:MAG: N-6 DNA methylase [Desulfuromonadales bacterium]|nr:N-6 DNA methylase [Desulfuromonadales bacterium]
MQEAHRLAWNFSYAPMLITIEPGLVRAWSCCEEPPAVNELNPLKAQIHRYKLNATADHGDLSSQAAGSLHWVQLVSGQYFKDNESHFKRNHCADYLLLENLKGLRRKLMEEKGLDQDICHDLLARIIFVQFLFHRKDSKGRPALDATRLNRLYEDRILSARYEELAQILENHDDSYALFQWLNNKFNGDLFPGKAQTEEERQAEWQLEKDNVRPEHLSLLADFISGNIEVGSGQISLWPQYSFDAIPIEFISSIYETFVGKKKGVVYTPGYLVDFILDGVLSWNDENWDVKILDPACGSGIFLVKAYQRLIHRWKKANRQEPRAEVLRGLLERNLFGVDIDPHAVRVASFSLYLAMCDAIDPRHYWDQVKFPQLRNRRLIASDFFVDDIPGFRTEEDKGIYDLVIGNAPWGKNIAGEPAKQWAKKHHWGLSYGDVGPLFLPKASALINDSGYLSLFQPAMNLLFNQSGPAQKFRSRLFEEFKVEEVVNLSALRFSLFDKKAISPACIITMRSCAPDAEPLTYICPKPTCSSSDDYRVVIEPHDVNKVYPHEAVTNALVWSVLMWGGRRDLYLIKRLQEANCLLKLEREKVAITREGIIRGGDGAKKNHVATLERRILETKSFPEGTFMYLEDSKLPVNKNPYTHRLTDLNAFSLPQLILKQSWQKNDWRFQSVIVKSSENENGIVCDDSYVSVHIAGEKSKWLESACLSYNSKVAVYYLLLASGRFASYRPSINVEDMLSVPIPNPDNISLADITSYDDIDVMVRKAFDFKESEWTLVEDLFANTLPDFKEGSVSPGRAPTWRKQYLEDETLSLYCHSFLKVLRAGFGADIRVSATIFQEKESFLPVRMVAIHFDSSGDGDIRHEPITSPALLARLQELNTKFMDISKAKGGIFYQRVVRVYDSVEINGQNVPTVYLIKPDQVRYWTRSMALRDADDVAADAMLWRKQALSDGATDTERVSA